MDKMLGPIGVRLVGAAFICLCIVLSASAAGMPSDLSDLQGKLKEIKSDSFKQYRELGGVQLIPYSLPSKERIDLSESRSSEQVSDLTAMNAVKERDLIYNGAQNGDSGTMEFVNSLDISVTGKERKKKVWPGEGPGDNDIEQIVDSALNTSMKNEEKKGQSAKRSPGLQQFGNNLDIDVSGISVSAINTVKGGSAVATSNIIIKPVQVIICPSEVEEKLK